MTYFSQNLNQLCETCSGVFGMVSNLIQSSTMEGTAPFCTSRDWILNSFGERCHLCALVFPHETDSASVKLRMLLDEGRGEQPLNYTVTADGSNPSSVAESKTFTLRIFSEEHILAHGYMVFQPGEFHITLLY